MDKAERQCATTWKVEGIETLFTRRKAAQGHYRPSPFGTNNFINMKFTTLHLAFSPKLSTQQLTLHTSPALTAPVVPFVGAVGAYGNFPSEKMGMCCVRVKPMCQAQVHRIPGASRLLLGRWVQAPPRSLTDRRNRMLMVPQSLDRVCRLLSSDGKPLGRWHHWLTRGSTRSNGETHDGDGTQCSILGVPTSVLETTVQAEQCGYCFAMVLQNLAVRSVSSDSSRRLPNV